MLIVPVEFFSPYKKYLYLHKDTPTGILDSRETFGVVDTTTSTQPSSLLYGTRYLYLYSTTRSSVFCHSVTAIYCTYATVRPTYSQSTNLTIVQVPGTWYKYLYSQISRTNSAVHMSQSMASTGKASTCSSTCTLYKYSYTYKHSVVPLPSGLFCYSR